jgi:hypothetical protein
VDVPPSLDQMGDGAFALYASSAHHKYGFVGHGKVWKATFESAVFDDRQ